MAKIESLNLLNSEDGKVYLAEKYKTLYDNISKDILSSKLKNKDLSGVPNSGTMTARRFVTAEIVNYGTARQAGKGKAVRIDEVDVKIDQDKELVEEVESKDIQLSGIDNLISKRIKKQTLTLENLLDEEFFKEAKAGAGKNKVNYKDTDKIEEILEDLIQAVETTKNDYVKGVKRNYINLVLSPRLYGKMRVYIDKIKGTDQEEIFLFHGVKVYSSINLPDKTDAIAMVDGAVAQPVKIDVQDVEKVNFSNAYIFGAYVTYGTKAVSPDLIYVLEKSKATA